MTLDSAGLESPSNLGGGEASSSERLSVEALGSGSVIGGSLELPSINSSAPGNEFRFNESVDLTPVSGSSSRGGDIVAVAGEFPDLGSTTTELASSSNGLAAGESSNDRLASPSNIVVGMSNSSPDSVNSSLIDSKSSSDENLDSHTESGESHFGEVAESNLSLSPPYNVESDPSTSTQSLVLPSSGSLEIAPKSTSTNGTLELSPITDDSENSANPHSSDSSPSPVSGGDGGKRSLLVSNSMLFIVVGSVAVVAFVLGFFYLRPKRTTLFQLTPREPSPPTTRNHFLELESTGPYEIANTPAMAIQRVALRQRSG
ncbi:hypothetical protein PsorP6_001275 [Peronosclerospora sorghi]|uniref:Uncharacterized protein n=1 Tax=Peronosclerospora sorghi TaxID=230839 RepID=A0ACC0WUM7_9STRA|nr:hypothetical protein PsorP6_001275 [Peronosclerospora sorghi]